MDNTPSQATPILRLEHVFKRFGGLTASAMSAWISTPAR